VGSKFLIFQALAREHKDFLTVIPKKSRGGREDGEGKI
jgi:hypothetical protein